MSRVHLVTFGVLLLIALCTSNSIGSAEIPNEVQQDEIAPGLIFFVNFI
jgi:hypothetical protein